MSAGSALRSGRRPMTFQLKPYLAAKRAHIDRSLTDRLDQGSGRVNAAMRYSLMAGGKRIRPILCIAAAEVAGGTEATAMDVACAIEMIHTYSLIHDDLPAMDDDALRRGKPTSHIRFDEATAILAGDALLTLAFQVLSAPAFVDRCGARTAVRLIHRLTLASGADGMIGGQMQDMATENSALTPAALQTMHRLKTGALIEAAAYCGAVVGGADDQAVQALCRYAACIGLSFQVSDDLLNVRGNEALTGKPSGTDAARGKNTYPALMGVEAAEAFARDLTQKALQALQSFDNRADVLRAVAHYIVERNR